LGIPIEKVTDIETTFDLNLSENNKWLQYYFVATDYKGWTTRIPFGDKYFEFGENPLNAELDDIIPAVNINLFPNPVFELSEFTAEIYSQSDFNVDISIIDIFGNIIKKIGKHFLYKGNNLIRIDVVALQQGIYILKIGNQIKKFTILK
jgi:hypothetical protein